MFERFTERARQVVVLAQDEARTLQHSHIGTEHILLGLLREEEGLAARALNGLDITTERTRAEVVRIVGQAEGGAPEGQVPFTPQARKILELSLREALSLGHNYIGTEHVLLGLIRENEGVAARILLDFDASAEKVHKEVLRMLTGAGHQREPRASGGDSKALTDDMIRKGLGKMHVRLRLRPELSGVFKTYDFQSDCCEVVLAGSGILEGSFWAYRKDLELMLPYTVVSKSA